MATLDLSKDIDRLRGEMDDLRKEISDYSRSARDYGLERGQFALRRVERFGRKARKQVARAERRLSHDIEERPLVAVLAAIGIGFLIAKLLDFDR